MTRAVRLTALALSGTLLLAAAGCGGGSAKTGTGSTASSKAPAAAPAGGWPQAKDGKLDEKMCGILTAADFSSFDRIATDKVETSKPANASNGIQCNYALDDTVTLELQPNAALAGQVYKSTLDGHQDGFKSSKVTSKLAQGVVTGADDSWYDVDPLSTGEGQLTDIDLWARRGALLVAIHLQGLMQGKGSGDPKSAAVGLAGLVLQRAPELGKTDTGTGHTMHLSVTGPGKATTLAYLDPTTAKNVELADVALPWSKDFSLASQGSAPILLSVTAASTQPAAALQCTITVDGKQVATGGRPGGLTFCSYTFQE
jgi:hypothetical protein